MGRYIRKRVGLIFLTGFIILFLSFYIIKLMPDNNRPVLGVDPIIWEYIKLREGYHLPIPQQFLIWLKNIFFEGTFGYSFYHKRDSWLVLQGRIPETIKLNLIPYLIAIPLGIFFGIVAALKKNKLTDHVISFLVVLVISVPVFVTAVLFQYFLVYKWKILPYAFVLPSYEASLDPIGNIVSRILPSVVIALGLIAGWTRSLRAELTEVLTSDYMLLAKAKGLKKSQTVYRHALRNAMVPFFPSITGAFISLLYGSIVVERAFGVAGIGDVYLGALGNRDFNLIMLYMAFYTFIGLIGALIGDLSYGIIDPRIKMGGGKTNE